MYVIFLSFAIGTVQSLIHYCQLSFENVVLKGLAADGGLFLPHEIPSAKDWVCLSQTDSPGQIFPRRLVWTIGIGCNPLNDDP